MNGYGHGLQHVFHQLFTGQGRCVIATWFYTPLKLATTIDLQRSKGLGKLVNGSLNCGSDMGIIQWKCEARPLFASQDLSISPKAIQASKGHGLQHVFHQLFWRSEFFFQRSQHCSKPPTNCSSERKPQGFVPQLRLFSMHVFVLF